MSKISRRAFIRGIGGGALTLIAYASSSRVLVLNALGRPRPSVNGPFLWLQVGKDGCVTVLIPHSEMGQGISTGLALLVAEELDVPWENVRFAHAEAAEHFVEPTSGLQFTGGSQSMRHRFNQLRTLGAAARVMLLRAAAKTWRVPISECSTREGRVVHEPSGRSLGYGVLAAKAALERVPLRVPLKPLEEARLLGRSLPRLDALEKVMGRARYGMDVALEGMCVACVARPPMPGARPNAWASQVPGEIKVVPFDFGVAVCAESFERAQAGVKALDVKWSAGQRVFISDSQIESALKDALTRKGASEREEGRVVEALARAQKVVDSKYFVPFLAHASMEPMACVASVTEAKCEIFTPTQAQTAVKRMAAKITGLPEEKVRVHTTFMAGAFGRYNDFDFVREAVLISKAVGRPVKLIWTREEDLAFDFFRPASASWVRAGLDSNGKLLAWWQRIAAPSIAERIVPMWKEAGIRPEAIANMERRLAKGIDDFGVEGFEPFQYEVPHLYYEFVKCDLPVRVGLWRSPGHNINGFVIESFVDEVAHALGKDPLEFRLSLLSNERARRVLEIAAEKGGWGKKLAPGHGLGIARYSSCGSHAAHVAEVSVDVEREIVYVHRVVAALDCGFAVHPDAIAAQLEGCVVMGLSATFLEQVRFEEGRVASTNFDRYKILRFSHTPEIEVFVVPSKEPVGGAGEPGLPSVAPAVTNAIFAACGIRFRSLPVGFSLGNPGTLK